MAKLALTKATLTDTPEPVMGIPELYMSLVPSLSSLQFIDISGLPYWLYLFIHNFISFMYSAPHGPILMCYLTVINIS